MQVLAAMAIFLLWIMFIILGPIAYIWCLNVLFHLHNEITFQTWLAALLLFAGGASIGRASKD